MTRGRALGAGRLWKRGRTWILDWREASGQRRSRSLGQNKAVAERRKAEIIRRRDMELDGLGGVEGMNLPLGDVAADYLRDLRPQVTHEHFCNVEARLNRTVATLGPKTRVRDLRPLDVRRIMNERVQEGAAHRTANLVGTTLKAMFSWAMDAGLIANSPLRGLKKLPETRDHQKCRRRALTDDEIERFLAASRANDAKAENHFGTSRFPQTTLWLAMLDTGSRWNEVRQLVWADVDFTSGILILRAENTKGRKQRSIPLTARLVPELAALRARHQRSRGRLPRVSDCVFLTPRGCNWGKPSNNPMRIFRQVLNAAGIAHVDHQGDKIDIHALRHTFGTRLARHGVGLVHAQRLMGHSDPKLTAQIYTHLDVDDLRGAMAMLDGATEPMGTVRRAE